MADTSRDLAALQALLADNTTGDISPQDLRDAILSCLSGYGHISVLGGATNQSGITATPVELVAFAADGPSSSDVTTSHGDNSITVSVAGKYLVNVQVSFSGTASKTYLLRAHVDTVATTLGCQRKLGTGGDVGSCSFSGVLSLAASQVVTVYVSSSDGGTDILAVDAQLVLTRVE
jgi:hypothetical protein